MIGLVTMGLVLGTMSVLPARAGDTISAGADGSVATDPGFDGPQVTQVRLLTEGDFLEVHWDRYVDENAAVDPANFVLKNGDTVIPLVPKGTGSTDTIFFDKKNKQIAATAANSMERLDDDVHFSSIRFNVSQSALDDSKGYTLQIAGSNILDEDGRAAEDATYADVPHVDFYTQHVTTTSGIVIKADPTVDAGSLQIAGRMVDAELSAMPQVAANMASRHASLAVYNPHHNVYFIPEHRYGYSYTMYDVEGYGGNQWNNNVSSIAERNILRVRDGRFGSLGNTAYPNESILLHEFGHCILSTGIDLLPDQSIRNAYDEVYANAKKKGLWPNTYMITNRDEFFATLMAIWFDVMAEKPTYDGVRSPINSRADLQAYDPVTYDFLADLLPADNPLPAPWDEPAPDEYHEGKVEPPVFDGVAIDDPDFDSDVFHVEGSVNASTFGLEQYQGSNPLAGGASIWWLYASDGDAAAANSWRLRPVTEGVYQVVVPDGSTALTAESATEVTFAVHAPDAEDPAQQWRFVEDPTSDDHPYDGKLINVKYGAALTSQNKKANNGNPVVLTTRADAVSWALRDTTRTKADGKRSFISPVPDQPTEPAWDDATTYE